MSNYAKRYKERPQKHGNFTTFSYLNNLSLLLCNLLNSGGHRHDDLIQPKWLRIALSRIVKKTSKNQNRQNRWFPNTYLLHRPSNTKAPFSAPCPESLRFAILHCDTCFHYFVGGRSCLLVENLFLQPTVVVKIQLQWGATELRIQTHVVSRGGVGPGISQRMPCRMPPTTMSQIHPKK